MLQLWRLTLRSLNYVPFSRHTRYKTIAIKSRSELDAVKFAKASIHSPEWWDGYLITEVEPIGELWAAEGFSVPMEED